MLDERQSDDRTVINHPSEHSLTHIHMGGQGWRFRATYLSAFIFKRPTSSYQSAIHLACCFYPLFQYNYSAVFFFIIIFIYLSLKHSFIRSSCSCEAKQSKALLTCSQLKLAPQELETTTTYGVGFLKCSAKHF